MTARIFLAAAGLTAVAIVTGCVPPPAAPASASGQYVYISSGTGPTCPEVTP